MRNFFSNSYIHDRLILVSLGAGLILNIILWIVIVSKFGLSHEQEALHFNIVYGIDLVGSSRQLYELPAAGLIIFLVNLWLAKLIYERDRLFSYFLAYGSLVAQLILGMGLLSLVILNK